MWRRSRRHFGCTGATNGSDSIAMWRSLRRHFGYAEEDDQREDDEALGRVEELATTLRPNNLELCPA